MFKENIKMSFENILSNKMRSFLTMLGVIIGVASIIALITIVSSATSSVTAQVSSMGANNVTIQVRGTPFKTGLSTSDLENLKEIDNVLGAAPTLSKTVNVVGKGNYKEDVTVQGKNEVYFENTEDLINTGRTINILDINNKNKVCIIGSDVSKELFYGENPIGKDLLIGGTNYKIIGTLQESSGFASGNQNDTVIVPYTTAMSFLGAKYINSLTLYLENGEISDDTIKHVESKLLNMFNQNEDAFSIMNMQDILDTVEQMTNMLSLMLGGIASISLIVGGIGIMNMMLVSVTERTSEIGLRKALGAPPSRIQQQFLIESIVLCITGGIIGVILGSTLALIVCGLLDTAFSLSFFTVLLSVGFSLIVGVLFGFTPARKASRLNPIDALRSA